MESKANGDINFRELLLGTATRVRHITRWSNFPKIHPESVAEHSFFTAMCALVIATDLQKRGWNVRMDVALARALMHDVEEAFSGDFARTFKHSDPVLDSAINRASARFHLQFCEAIVNDETAQTLHNYWKQSKAGDVEGSIVAFADYLALISYVMCELRSGNSHLLERRMSLFEYGEQFLSDAVVKAYARPVLELLEREFMRCP